MGKATKLRAAKSWIMLGFLILASFTVILLGREQQDLFTGRVTIQPIAYMKAGSQELIEIKGIPCLASVTVFFGIDTKYNQLRVEENEQIRFEGNSCAKFTVSWKDAAAVERMEFQFKVLEGELFQKGINPADLRLYANGKELPTTKTKSDERYIYYIATSREAGEYVLGKASRAKTAQPTTAVPAPEIPATTPRPEEQPAGLVEEQEPISPSAPESAPAVGQAIQRPAPEMKESVFGRFLRTIRSVFKK